MLNMTEEILSELPVSPETTSPPEIALEADEVVLPPIEEAAAIENILVATDLPADVPEALPSEAATTLLSIKSDGDSFLSWALDSSIAFLNLADLERVKTAESLRGIKEAKIRDKIQMANSVLVLLANYASEKDNKEIVAACELYAAKMQTIIKRLCL